MFDFWSWTSGPSYTKKKTNGYGKTAEMLPKAKWSVKEMALHVHKHKPQKQRETGNRGREKKE